MTELHIPTGNIMGMVFSLIVAWGLPISLFIWIWKKKKGEPFTFFLGCGSFFLFAMLLEQLFHSFMLFKLGPVSKAIQNNLLLYALYGGLAAGLFEETGRFLTMKYLIKDKLSRENALMYGAGHGGMEAVLILGMTSLNNLVQSFMINSGSLAGALSDNMDLETVLLSLSPLAELPAWQFFLGGAERIMAIAVQIGLSLLVYQAVKTKDSWYFFPIAVGLHMAVDAVVVVAANYGMIIFAEILTLAGTILIVYAAWKWSWNRETMDLHIR